MYVNNITTFFKENFLSLAKSVICQWDQSHLLAFCNLEKKLSLKYGQRKPE